jgi:alkanesulfonate monooxygenase SsuD/methylene tetrahydromethanopterin reductase-like flavin-dependent oxidoreductase (luciferase family)
MDGSQRNLMRLGFFTMPIHPLDKDWRQSLREDREAFVLADELGFAEGFAGEHVTYRAENITSCTMFIASLADAVKRMKLGTGTVNLPNNHPATVAAQIAMLDHLRRSRHLGLAAEGRGRAARLPRDRRRLRHAALRWQGLGRPCARAPLHGAHGREGDAGGQRRDRRAQVAGGGVILGRR